MYKIKYYLWILGLVICFGTNAYSADNTNIHTTISTELLESTSPCDTSIATGDCDGDGLNNGEEITGEDDQTTSAIPECQSDPNDACSPLGQDVGNDCDNDGIANSQEILDGTDPNNPCDPPNQDADVDADCDGDGFTNHNEILEGTDPSNPCEFPGQDTGVDCDGDGLTFNEEDTGVDDENTMAIPNGQSNPTDRCSPSVMNNIKDDATNIPIGADCLYGFNVCADDEATPSHCGYGKSSVWYEFNVTNPGYYEIKTNYASFNHALTLFNSGGAEIACTNEGGFSFREHLYELLSADNYYVMVTSVEEEMTVEENIIQGVFCIDVNVIAVAIGQGEQPIPVNQNCSEAYEVTLNSECDITLTGNNRYASYAYPQPSCNPYAGASVWYKFQTPSSNFDKIQISTVVNYSEVISVYEGDCGSLEEIACKLNGTDGIDDLIISNLEASTTYYVQISGNLTSIEASNTDCDEGSITISTNPDCTALENEPCNDYNPNTINDVWDANCICTSDCLYEGDICDDGSDQTINDTFDSDCNCTAECTIGAPCDDGNAETTNDRWTTDATSTSCICLGTIPGACLEDIIVNSSNVSDGLFEASNSIQTSGTVAVNGSLELRAGQYINLMPGFSSTGPTTYFNGRIEECTPIEERTEQEARFASVKHYPNPFRDEVNLEFTLDYDAEVQIIISDVNGRSIVQANIDNLNRGTQIHSISTQNWVPGIYFYQALIKEQNTGIQKRANGTLVKM